VHVEDEDDPAGTGPLDVQVDPLPGRAAVEEGVVQVEPDGVHAHVTGAVQVDLGVVAPGHVRRVAPDLVAVADTLEAHLGVVLSLDQAGTDAADE
jgi:hypothetical protein